MSLETNLRAVQDKINAACAACDRDPADVHLIAVSKTFPGENIETLYQTGHRHFGENYVQEMTEKATTLAEAGLDELEWHFIGRIQSNKIKYIAAHANYVHTLEKVSHAKSLGKHAGRLIKVLVSVNIGEEESKGGVAPDEVIARCEEIHALENIEVHGLMCIPPRCENPEDAAPYFQRMAALAAEGRERGMPLTQLSMGMSQDFHVAIRYGATFVRVGRAIFGARG